PYTTLFRSGGGQSVETAQRLSHLSIGHHGTYLLNEIIYVMHQAFQIQFLKCAGYFFKAGGDCRYLLIFVLNSVEPQVTVRVEIQFHIQKTSQKTLEIQLRPQTGINSVFQKILFDVGAIAVDAFHYQISSNRCKNGLVIALKVHADIDDLSQHHALQLYRCPHLQPLYRALKVQYHPFLIGKKTATGKK